jgi:regulation of enolase protein 1 (concanavalin A-like superfamily)
VTTGSLESIIADTCAPARPWCWRFGPESPSRVEDGALALRANARSDLFAMGALHHTDALGALVREAGSCFTFSATVEVDGGTFADAAGLLMRSTSAWLKLCVERKRRGGWAVVSVFGAPDADEAHGIDLAGGSAALLLTREGRRVAAWLRAEPGGDWRFHRTLWWPDAAPAAVGVFAQAPFSTGHWARFEELRLTPDAREDKR